MNLNFIWEGSIWQIDIAIGYCRCTVTFKTAIINDIGRTLGTVSIIVLIIKSNIRVIIISINIIGCGK